MKTREQLFAALDEIREVCNKHGILLIGGCESEGIYGEISFICADEPGEYAKRTAFIFNLLDGDETRGYNVAGIGDVK